MTPIEITIIILILFIGLLPWTYAIFKYIIKKIIKLSLRYQELH